MELHTARLLLRDFTPEDLADFTAYRSDPRSTEFSAEPKTEPASEALLATFIGWAADRPRRAWQLAITSSADPSGRVIGTAGLRLGDASGRVAEFGIELDPRQWRRGHASEAARALIEHGFTALSLEGIEAQTVSANRAVAALLESLGFERRGESAGSEAMRRRGWRHVDWRLTREAWAATSRGALRKADWLRPRRAVRQDIPGMHAVRLSVRENRLSDPSRITPEQYESRLTPPDGAWVVEVEGRIAGFAIADFPSRSIWALFVKPGLEGRGIGRVLLQRITESLEAAGPGTIHLSTEAGSRAARVYAAAGWTEVGRLPNGELHFVRTVTSKSPQ